VVTTTEAYSDEVQAHIRQALDQSPQLSYVPAALELSPGTYTPVLLERGFDTITVYGCIGVLRK
jgi:hypothetical protein